MNARKPSQDYRVNGVDLSDIRNRNEKRVIELMPRALSEFKDFLPETMDIEDIYARTLNRLPARYKQKGTVILREPVKDEQILSELRDAIESIMTAPNYPRS